MLVNRIQEINLDSLIRWKIEHHSALSLIAQSQFDLKLAHFRELDISGEICRSSTRPRNLGFWYVGALRLDELKGCRMRLNQLLFCGFGCGGRFGWARAPEWIGPEAKA